MVGNYVWNVAEKNSLSHWLAAEGLTLITLSLHACLLLAVSNVKSAIPCRALDRTLKGHYHSLQVVNRDKGLGSV
jgi:hypothetical protein